VIWLRSCRGRLNRGTARRSTNGLYRCHLAPSRLMRITLASRDTMRVPVHPKRLTNQRPVLFDKAGERVTPTVMGPTCCIFLLRCTISPTSNGAVCLASQQYTVPLSSPLASNLPSLFHVKLEMPNWCLVIRFACSFILGSSLVRVSKWRIVPLTRPTERTGPFHDIAMTPLVDQFDTIFFDEMSQIWTYPLLVPIATAFGWSAPAHSIKRKSPRVSWILVSWMMSSLALVDKFL
jgi:hypothetical protein